VRVVQARQGTSPEAARFRLLLEDQLFENGFVVVAKREEADAVLSGRNFRFTIGVLRRSGGHKRYRQTRFF